eukprot:9467014-Pyramimonas_sp.AAC.2
MAPTWPAQDDPTMGPSWPQGKLRLGGAKRTSRFGSQGGPKIAPAWPDIAKAVLRLPQHGPIWHQDAPRWPRDGNWPCHYHYY